MGTALLTGPGAEPASGDDAAQPPARVAEPQIRNDKIPYGKQRRRQMAGYSERHYGRHQWRLERPKAIVLHYTAGGSWRSARDWFAANQPNRGELPGVCAHYIVDQRGKIHLIVSRRIRCRHAIGLNWTAIGIEFVQRDKGSARATDRAILERRRQLRAGLRLVAFLREREEIPMRDVIGHSMANASRYFKDRKGWRNDHVDWQRRSVHEFREKLRARFGQG